MEVFGTAVSIDTGSAVLAILDPTRPKLGEVIDLELQLPANTASTAARCLALRARVEQVVEMRDGTRQMTVRFRKAAFKDSEKPPRKPPKAAAAKEWEM